MTQIVMEKGLYRRGDQFLAYQDGAWWFGTDGILTNCLASFTKEFQILLFDGFEVPEAYRSYQ